MGIESQYLGEINIPEEHRAEYAQQALKLLRAGGMVTVEPVQLYGHKLHLLSPPELDEEDGKAVIQFLSAGRAAERRSCPLRPFGPTPCGRGRPCPVSPALWGWRTGWSPLTGAIRTSFHLLAGSAVMEDLDHAIAAAGSWLSVRIVTLDGRC